MLKKMNAGDLLGAISEHVEVRTGIRCHTAQPDDQPSPLYYAQLVKTEPRNTKGFFVERYKMWFHCVAEPVEPHSDGPALDLANMLEEALTDEIRLPRPFVLNNQEGGGIQSVKRDESGEGHAVVAHDFDIQWGFRCK